MTDKELVPVEQTFEQRVRNLKVTVITAAVFAVVIFCLGVMASFAGSLGIMSVPVQIVFSVLIAWYFLRVYRAKKNMIGQINNYKPSVGLFFDIIIYLVMVVSSVTLVLRTDYCSSPGYNPVGWFIGVLPITFFLYGVSRIFKFDISQKMPHRDRINAYGIFSLFYLIGMILLFFVSAFCG